MVSKRFRTLLVASATLALLGGALGAVAAPAFADDPPPLDWTLVSQTTVDDVTVTWERAESNISPFDSSMVMLDPMPVYRPNIVNHSGETREFGFGTDFVTQGVIDEAWTAEAWGAFGEAIEDANFFDIFRAELAPGESYESISGAWYPGMPAWSGHTITVFALDPSEVEGENPVATPISSITTPGRYVGADLTVGDVDNISTALGNRASVAGVGGAPQLFAGLTGTVQAQGLTPGEPVELWIAHDLNFVFFQVLGGGLPVDAIQVGTATVAADGSLSAAFALPPDLAPANYQLVVGDRSERYWPSGSWDDFTVGPRPLNYQESETPDAGPGGEPAEMTLEDSAIGDITIGVVYPDGSTAGTTGAVYSTTGPLPLGFTLATDPPVYVHVNTTVALAGPTEVCFGYDAALVAGDPPHLFHFNAEAGEWEDITTNAEPGLVCGETSSFSPFTLGYPATFDFSGFLDPVSMDAENIAKPGQAVPVKFSLGGDQGLDVVTSAKFVLEGAATSLVGETIDATAAGGSGLSYDAVTDQYTYVWKTSKAWSLKQGRFELTLSDDTVHTFDVTFKK